MINLLRELCQINGVSGDEARVRELIISKINDKADITIDNGGNIIAFKKGKKRPQSKILFSAHMDEVGFIINSIDDNGYLYFESVGGIDPKILMGRVLKIGENEVTGAIGVTPVHLISDEQKGKNKGEQSMYIDIGAVDKNDAMSYVSLGDCATFASDFVLFGDKLIKAKAIDDRLGCAILIKMLESELEYDCFFSFVCQEEIGLRGANMVSQRVMPQYAFVLESTTADDIDSVEKCNRMCTLGEGAVISFKDNSTYYNKELIDAAFSCAKRNNYKLQLKRGVAGGNDAGAIAPVSGAKTLAISAPCRYLHTGSNVICRDDIDSMIRTCEDMLSYAGGNKK